MKSNLFLCLLILFLLVFSNISLSKEKSFKSELIILFDDSGSMDNDNAIGIARDKLKALFSKVKKQTDMIGLEKITIFPMNMYSKSFSSPFEGLESYVDSLKATGGTNFNDKLQSISNYIANKEDLDYALVFAFTDGAYDPHYSPTTSKGILELNASGMGIHLEIVQIGSGDEKALQNSFKNVSPNTPYARTIGYGHLKNMKSLDKVLTSIPEKIMGESLRKKLSQIIKKEDQIIIHKNEFEKWNNEVSSIDSSLLLFKKELKVGLNSLVKKSKKATADIAATKTQFDNENKVVSSENLSSLLAGYIELIQEIKGFGNRTLMSHLYEFDALNNQLVKIEDNLGIMEKKVSIIIDQIEEVKKLVSALKSSGGNLPASVNKWMEGYKSSSININKLKDNIAKSIEMSKKSRLEIGEIKTDSLQKIRSFHKSILPAYENYFLNTFGKQWEDELRKLAAETGTYWDEQAGELVLTGINYTGGSSSSSRSGRSSSRSNIKVRNEGILIELPGSGGSGGAQHVSTFINNGTIIKSASRSSIGGSGGYTLFLNNGKVIHTSHSHYYSTSERSYSWTTFENGVLIFIEKDNTIERAIYISIKEFESIVKEIASSMSTGDAVRFSVGSDLEYMLKGLKVTANATSETVQVILEGILYLINSEKYSITSSGYENTQKAWNDKVIINKEDELRFDNLKNSSNTLSKYDRDLWPTIMIIIYGSEFDGKNLVEEKVEKSPTLISKSVHTGVSLAEIMISYKRFFPGAKMGTAKTKGFIGRWTGRVFRWSLGAVLAYDATKSLYFIYGLNIEPGWKRAALSWIPENVDQFIVDKVEKIRGESFNIINREMTPEQLMERLRSKIEKK